MSVHVLRCPNCGADLDVVDGAETIRCRFCRTPCCVDWRGMDPVLTREAQEFVEALNAIDLDALEKGLDELNAMLDADQQRKQLPDEATGHLTTDEQLDQMARQLIESGKASEFLQGVDDLPNDSADPHVLLARDIMHRLASRIQAIQRQNSTAAIAATRERTRERADLEQRQREIAEEKARLTIELAKAQQESADADRDYLLALRSKYLRSRFWAFAGFPLVLLFIGGLGAMFVYFDWATWLWWVGWVLIVLSPFSAYQFSVGTWKEGTEAAWKFNERAFLHGLPEIRVKTREQLHWEQQVKAAERSTNRELKRAEREWQRLFNKPEGSAWLGCLILVGAFGLAVVLCSNRDGSTANQAGNDAPAQNDAPSDEGADALETHAAEPDSGEPRPVNEPKTD